MLSEVLCFGPVLFQSPAGAKHPETVAIQGKAWPALELLSAGQVVLLLGVIVLEQAIFSRALLVAKFTGEFRCLIPGCLGVVAGHSSGCLLSCVPSN